MRISHAPAYLLTALLAAFLPAHEASGQAISPEADPDGSRRGALSAFPGKIEVRYLVVDGQVFAVNAFSAGGAAYVALEEVAARLGFEVASREKGLVLRTARGTIAFSEDFSMAIVGAHLHAVRPGAFEAGGAVFVPAAFVSEHFARFASAPFSIRETPPPLEMKTLPCSIRADGTRWILGFEEPPVHVHRATENAVEVFFEGQRLKTSAGGESPSGVRLKHERLPLGDRLRWTWDKAAPHAADVAASGDGREIVVSFSSGVPRRKPSGLAVVVLDPGHGGAAAGAIGRGGLLEKDLALRVALKVRDILVKQGVEVLMTREADEDVSLDARAEFANSRRGGLFVSIHANASRRASARGAETYFMSYEALDEESSLAAEIENREGVPDANAGAGGGDSVGAILATLAQARFLDESSRLAEEIQRKFNAALSTPDRGVKQAPFAVLMGVAMPAVLVEVGFLSNPDEERLLYREDYRDKIARALAESVLAFKRARDAGDAAHVEKEGAEKEGAEREASRR